MVNNIKKIFMSIFACILGLASFVGLYACGENKSGKINVVCTIFPEYDWVR